MRVGGILLHILSMTEDEGAKEKAGRLVVVGRVIIMLTLSVCRFNYGIVKFTDVVEENKVWCTLKL